MLRKNNNLKKELPKIVVLLASYNGDKYISHQIDSILNQKDVLIYLFISDDSSTDSSKQIIGSYIENNSNIVLLNHKRIGGPAKNFYFLLNQIDTKKFDFIALADQDDLWPDYRLARAVEQLVKHKSDAYSSDVIAVDESEKFLKIIKKSQPQKKWDYVFETPGPGCSFVMTSTFTHYLQSQLKDDVLNFPYHDWLIYALGRHAKFKWIIDDAPNLFYRQHQHNFMGANFGFKSRLKRLNRILFGEYYKELITLYDILNLERKNLNFMRVWYFIFQFHHTRRKFRHALLMIPFLLIVSIQKNEV